MKSMKINKVRIHNILSNNLFIIGVLFNAAPIYGIDIIIEAIRHELINFIEHTYCVGFILEGIEYGKSFEKIRNFLLFLIALQFVASILSNVFDHYIQIKYLPKVQEKLKLMLYKKAKEIDLACYDNPDYYNQFVLAVSEVEKGIDRAENLLRMLFSGITIFVCYGTFFLSKDSTSIIFVIVSFVLRMAIGAVANKFKFNIRLRLNPLERKRNYIHRIFYLNEYAKELRLNKDASSEMHKEFNATNEEIYSIQKEVGIKRFLFDFFAGYVATDFIMDVVYISYLIFKATVLKLISYSSVVVMYNSAGNLRRGFIRLTDLVPYMIETSLYVDKIRTFLQYETKIKNYKRLAVPKEPKELKLEHIKFSYVDGGEEIINDISMTINSHEKIAFVGYNGAGKTTLTKLIMRLYDPISGKITLDGVDIRDYDVEEYRNYIGAVFQDFRLYAATVEENIVMDVIKDEESKDKVIDSLQQSGSYNKIIKLQNGLNTPLTTEFEENGTDLSGGEGQKLAVARGFYKDSSIIILDEPSSALDPIAEYNLNQSMFSATKAKTVIFISHRLSTTRKADRIYMLEKGRIIEEGTHEKLLAQGGRYAEMWDKQSGMYK